MHDCNRHRPNGYKDRTWEARVKDDTISQFNALREQDRDRRQNKVNSRFPSLAEARDQYLQMDRVQDSDRVDSAQ